MKFLVALTFIVILWECEAARNKKRYKAEETCTTELGLSRAKMKALVNEFDTSEDNKTYGEFLVCVFRKRGIMNENGMIDGTNLKSFLRMVFTEDFGITGDQKKSTVAHVYEQCRYSQADAFGKTSIRLKNCIVRHIKQFESEF